MTQTARRDDSTPAKTLYVAFELSKDTWKLAFAVNRVQRPRMIDTPARNTKAVLEALAEAKRRLKLPKRTPVKSCYEAGRDGFWLQRFLESIGVENVIFEAASIEVSRRKRKVKTDRVDAQKLVRLLIRHHDGEDVVKIVRTPPAEVEDERLLPRLVSQLKRERTRLLSSIRATLFLHGVDLNPRLVSFRERLVKQRQWNGEALPPGVLRVVDVQTTRLELLQSQIKSLEKELCLGVQEAAAGNGGTSAQKKAGLLSQLCGIGEPGAYVLATEFGWREFRNRKEVGALAGLTGTPFSSGGLERDQGISKAGNVRVRGLVVQQAWGWLRHQPQSELTKWYRERVGKGGSRDKRKAIVAVARKLLIQLWHLMEHGVVPPGAVFKDESVARVALEAA